MILIFAQSTVKKLQYLRNPRLPRTSLDALECDLLLEVYVELVLRAVLCSEDELCASFEATTATPQSHSDSALVPDVV